MADDMARPHTITEHEVERCAAMYACGGELWALAETFGVQPDTLRRRIVARYGGMPTRLQAPPCMGTLDSAAQLLDSMALATNSDDFRRMASAVREAIAVAWQMNQRIIDVGNGRVPPPVPSRAPDGA
jgi:hypothetical protein